MVSGVTLEKLLQWGTDSTKSGHYKQHWQCHTYSTDNTLHCTSWLQTIQTLLTKYPKVSIQISFDTNCIRPWIMSGHFKEEKEDIHVKTNIFTDILLYTIKKTQYLNNNILNMNMINSSNFWTNQTHSYNLQAKKKKKQKTKNLSYCFCSWQNTLYRQHSSNIQLMWMRVNQQWSPLVTSDGGGGDLSQGGVEGHQDGEQ